MRQNSEMNCHRRGDFGAHREKATLRWLFLDGCAALAGEEHVTAISHVIVRHEQLTGKSLEVKKAGDALGNIVEHAKLQI